jgi:hypothetical protein
MSKLLTAIVEDDAEAVKQLLRADRASATQLIQQDKLYDSQIFHWIYVGDTPLHLAAAGYRVEIIMLLLDAGADVKATKNRRHSSPLHYAADGCITAPAHNAQRQVTAIRYLIERGADIHLPDNNGATPLHRAVRTRCAAAVKLLLAAGSDPRQKNKPGSTSFHLAVQNTGRGGSGEPAAIAAQREIIEAFLASDVSTKLKDGKGQSVLDCARSQWIRDLLIGSHPR